MALGAHDPVLGPPLLSTATANRQHPTRHFVNAMTQQSSQDSLVFAKMAQILALGHFFFYNTSSPRTDCAAYYIRCLLQEYAAYYIPPFDTCHCNKIKVIHTVAALQIGNYHKTPKQLRIWKYSCLNWCSRSYWACLMLLCHIESNLL